MHILLIHQAFAAVNEAGGTRHYEMASHLAKNNHHVTIITSPVSYMTGEKNDPAGQQNTEDVFSGRLRIIRSYSIPALHKSFFHRLLNFFSFMVSSFLKGLAARQVDLVWGTTPPIFQAVTGWLLARMKRVPYVLEVRDLWPDFAIDVGVLNNRFLISASRWLEKFLYRHADHIIVNSPGFIQHIKAKTDKPITLIPNGVDTSMFYPPQIEQEIKTRYGLDEKFVVLYAGAHGLANDLTTLLEAAEHTSSKPEIKIVLVGDGKEKPALMAYAEARHMNNVLFMPPVSKQQMHSILAASDACLAILKPIDMFKTTYPNKVFDYMAAAKPVILAIDGVIREVVETAGCGIFAAPGNSQALADAIKTLAADPGNAAQMGKNGRSYVEKHFNRADFSARLEELFTSLVDKK